MRLHLYRCTNNHAQINDKCKQIETTHLKNLSKQRLITQCGTQAMNKKTIHV